jgi:6-phosphogluconolactonase
VAVTERLSNSIDIFKVLADVALEPIVVHPSVGLARFPSHLHPTAPRSFPKPDLLTSRMDPLFMRSLLMHPFRDQQQCPHSRAANCWNAITPDGRFVYVSNVGSSTISGSAIAANGSLSALPGAVVGANPTGATNLDLTVSPDGKFLYTLNSHNGTIGIFAIQNDGTLKSAGTVGGITQNSGFSGIVAN